MAYVASNKNDDDADDSAVGEEEKCRRQDVVQDEHRERICGVHCRRWPLKRQALTVDH